MFTGLVLFPLMPSMAFVYAIMPIIAIGNGLSIANLGGLISKSVSAEKQGAALGVNGSLGALGNSAAPIIAGLASGPLGIAAPFIFGALLVLSSWVRLFVIGRKTD
jgi:predicted MFS family arabinose efflux permease